MNRRRFLRAGGELLAASLAPGVLSCQGPPRKKRSFDFLSASEGTSEVRVRRVTPADGFYVFSYYDVCPFSPSGRYLAVTRLPYQDRWPRPGDAAEVCLVDLTQATIETVYSTRSWGFQLGAFALWGATDRFLYVNDVLEGRTACVRIDLESGQVRSLAGPMGHVAPDDSCVVGFPPELLNVTQRGYGPPAQTWDAPPHLPPGAARDEGVWRTDGRTHEKRLLYSLADVAARVPVPPPRPDGTFYFWHTRFNPQGTRLLQVSRCLFPDRSGRMNAMVFTLKPDGSDIRYTPAGPASTDTVWGVQGGHPNWHPDGEHILRHLTVGKGPQRFCKIRADGTRFQVLSDRLVATGHPSAEPSGRFLITDRFDEKDGPTKVTLRWIDLARNEDRDLCTLPSIDRRGLPDDMFRLDGHPVWSRDYRQACLQATSDGRRAIYLVDLPEA